MGTCTSVHKDPQSTLRFRVVVGTKKVNAPSPARGGTGGLHAGGFDPRSSQGDTGNGFRSPHFGSKDETFFDSRAWLDSDCEDDFFSVNGDFTPSHGSTPNYQIATAMKPQQQMGSTFHGFPDPISEPSPRKKLVELFQETSSGEPTRQESNGLEGKVQVNETTKETNIGRFPNLSDGPPCFSGTNSMCSGERTPNGDFTYRKEKAGKATQCCLPNLVPSLSFNDKKKQTTSSEPHSDG